MGSGRPGNRPSTSNRRLLNRPLSSPEFPTAHGSDPGGRRFEYVQLGDVVELFVRREDAEWFLTECLADAPEWVEVLEVAELELAVSLNQEGLAKRAKEFSHMRALLRMGWRLTSSRGPVRRIWR